jgi:hypothetical protein
MQTILILKFPYESSYGGGEKHTLELFEQLNKKGYHFILCSSCPTLLQEFQKRKWQTIKFKLCKEPVTPKNIISFPLKFIFIWLKLIFIIKKISKIYNIDIIYCLSLTEKFLTRFLTPIISQKFIWIEHSMINNWLTKNPLNFLYKLGARKAKIITVSEAVKNQILTLNIKKKSITTIYNGIHINKEKKDTKNISNNKINTAIYTIGTACRLHKEKGVINLLTAIQKIDNIIPNLHCLIIGDGPQKNDLVWAAKKMAINDKVRFIGWKNNITPWLKTLDIFILPSIKKESFGYVLLEAGLAKKPIIASNTGGIPEIVIDKKTGLLYSPNNPEEIAQKIIYLYNAPFYANTLAEQAHDRIKNKFTIEKMVSDYIKVFENV